MDNNFELNAAMLEKINKYTRRPLTAEEVYAFPVVLCDNEIDRDNERFSIEALRRLAVLFVGKTGIFDHDAKGKNQTARIFDVEVKTDTDRVTSASEPYTCLVAKAYMVRTEKSADLIAEIDGGIKKEVSVSCSVGREVCSICGADRKKSPCMHVKGAEYGGEVCCGILDEPMDAYEWSFVAVPAQKNAGVTKKYGSDGGGEGLVQIKSEMAKLKKENAAARQLIKGEILRLSFLCSPILTVKTVGMLTENMPLEQLMELKQSLEKDLAARQPAEPKSHEKTVKTNDNKNFKIN